MKGRTMSKDKSIMVWSSWTKDDVVVGVAQISAIVPVAIVPVVFVPVAIVPEGIIPQPLSRQSHD